jgi:hypothetical protein
MFEFMRSISEVREMPIDKAISIFKKFGASDEDINSPSKLKIFRNSVMMNGVHSDIGGSDKDAADLNAAYDALKNGVSNDDYEYADAADDGSTPIWAMAGHSGGYPPNARINKQNYTDMNYFKKSMYMMSKNDKEQKVYLVWAFDGYFFRNCISVYASPKIFQEVAQAMIMWNSHGGNSYATRAVFVQKNRDPELYLIYADGKYYNDNPVHFEHDSFNLNPGNDQHFVRRLPTMLDKLKEGG